MSPREDALVVRRLCEFYGPEHAAAWQRVPYVMLPGDRFLDHLAENLAGADPDLPADQRPAIDHVPWTDFVLDCGRLRATVAGQIQDVLLQRMEQQAVAAGTIDRLRPLLAYQQAVTSYAKKSGNMWCRVRDLRLVRFGVTNPWFQPGESPENAALCRTLSSGGYAQPGRWLYLEFYDEEYARSMDESMRRKDYRFVPEMTLLDRRDPMGRGGVEYVHYATRGGNMPCQRCLRKGPQPLCPYSDCPHWTDQTDMAVLEGLSKVSTRLIADALLYLSRCDEHMVRVRPPAPDGPDRARRTAAIKPWLREDLPRVILIDPARAVEYRSAGGEPQGTHASPRPHQRRGHWRQLRAERYREKRRMWIRPMWIGDAEWADDAGQTYKVLGLPRPDDETDRRTP